MPAPDTIQKLVEKFDYNQHEYKNPKYNETQVRIEFLNPFWEALDWDVTNRKGYALPYREVVHEDEVKVSGSTKAPDYSFRIGGRRIFFLEAKKPARDLKHDPEPAFQLRRYAYSAKLPVSMLSDFEELSIYDTRIKPSISDKSHVGRMLYFHYSEYIDKWDEIAATFSKEAIKKGAFDRFIEDKTKGRGTATIDRDFLNSLDEWRILLARNIALRNPDLSEREVNYAVQMTLDRLIFLRMAEDRGIQTYGTLQALQNGENCYRRLVEIYYQADERYNSGLFHFDEKDGQNPDVITPDLELDSKVLKEIIKNLYYPCPYEFSQMPVEVLGNAYEQFLGKRITLTGGHRAKIEEKPEVRKAGGVYYTPEYIVDYIVDHTVGELLKEKTPQEVSDLRILDPACGSGSFLVGAYQYLLDWHRNTYEAEYERSGTIPTSPPATGQRKRKSDPQAIFQDPNGLWALTTTEKKRILLNNIYGVDIDANAVEVTKLSLLLKVLENENSETLNHQLGLWHERALPNLANNIKCGNSLIGPDYYDHQQGTLFDEQEMLRVNAFDWEKEFAEVFEQGGFDAVIGNPPYGALFTNDEKQYIKIKYKSYKNRYDSYIYFIEKGYTLIKNGGYLSYITPELWLRLDMGENIRQILFANKVLVKVLVHGEKVFSDAIVNTCTFIIRKNGQNKYVLLKSQNSEWELSYNHWGSTDGLKIDYRINNATRTIIDKIISSSDQLTKLGKATQGITPYDKYRGQSDKIIKSRAFHFDKKKDETCGKWLAGKDISRYFSKWSGEWLSYGDWLAASRSPEFFTGERLLFREIPGKNKRIQATYIEKEVFYHGHSITPFKITKDNFSLLYILAIVNSKLLSWLGQLLLPNFGKNIFPKLNPKDILQLPIKKIDLEKPKDKTMYTQLVNSAQKMLKLEQSLAVTRDPHTSEKLKRQIDSTDAQIDRLVYELYDLTEKEIKIVEESVS
jgi:hypothetical protein